MADIEFAYTEAGVTAPVGIRAAGVHAGFRKDPRRLDAALVVSDGPGTVACGMFTKNVFCAAPVQVDRELLAQHAPRAVLLNSGNANAATGEPGLAIARKSAQAAAHALGLPDGEVLVASTGVIGVELSWEPFEKGIPALVEKLSKDGGHDAACAIMTTDTHPKECAVRFTYGGNEYAVGGMVKGSGMIAPQLATMLCVITTDAVVSAGQMQAALAVAAEHSFNRIDVDGCMSTNDTVLLLASGASGVEPDKDEFNKLVREACASLSRQIIGDGEGASHDIRITVTGATSEDAALACGRAVAASNLLKCAISGNDPNWGRIVSSLGTVPPEVAPYDSNKVTVDVNGVRICENGGAGRDRSEVDMTPREVHIDIDLNTGSDAEATVWTDDLTHEYVHINADYES